MMIYVNEMAERTRGFDHSGQRVCSGCWQQRFQKGHENIPWRPAGLCAHSSRDAHGRKTWVKGVGEAMGRREGVVRQLVLGIQ